MHQLKFNGSLPPALVELVGIQNPIVAGPKFNYNCGTGCEYCHNSDIGRVSIQFFSSFEFHPPQTPPPFNKKKSLSFSVLIYFLVFLFDWFEYVLISLFDPEIFILFGYIRTASLSCAHLLCSPDIKHPSCWARPNLPRPIELLNCQLARGYLLLFVAAVYCGGLGLPAEE